MKKKEGVRVNSLFTLRQEIYVDSLSSFLQGEQGDQKDLTEREAVLKGDLN
jgi:hypothetical protein